MENIVSFIVAELIVDLLKIIDIEDRDSARIELIRVLQYLACRLDKVFLAVDSRDPVSLKAVLKLVRTGEISLPYHQESRVEDLEPECQEADA